MEFDFLQTSASAIVRSVDRHGCALVRSAIPKDLSRRYLEALDSVYQKQAETPQDFPPEMKQGDVSPDLLKKHTGLEIASLFRNDVLRSVARRMVGSYTEVLSTYMSVAAGAKHSFGGFNLHTDGIIQGTEDLILCMWAPLHPCGVDAPGITVVPAGRKEVLPYLRAKFPGKEIPGWSSTTEWESTGAFNVDTIRNELGEPWRPSMEPGDVMLFTNWTIHGSNVTPKMNRRRSAAILRLKGLRFLQSLRLRIADLY